MDVFVSGKESANEQNSGKKKKWRKNECVREAKPNTL